MQQHSIKGIFQQMNKEGAEIFKGKVIKEKPLTIQSITDSKLVLSATLVVPRHLTDYEVECDIEAGKGNIFASIVNDKDDFQIKKAKLKVYNALKLNEIVWMLAVSAKKIYYVMDREE